MTTIDTPARLEDLISPQEASHVLWHYGELAGAMEPGGFTRKLIAAIDHADPVNRYRLSMGFRGYVAAVTLVLEDEAGGVGRLRTVAGIELCTRCSGTGMMRAVPPVMERGEPRHLDVCDTCHGRGAL